jgi:hypothetical protein
MRWMIYEPAENDIRGTGFSLKHVHMNVYVMHNDDNMDEQDTTCR